MAEAPREPRPAQPLTGYRDIGADEASDSRGRAVRTWLIIAVLALLYLGWTLTVYFLEPGLR
jgi:hypothetical protein